MVEQSNWSIQGPDLDLTHLREPDVRLKLLDIPENKLSEYRVRHGRGDWNDAAKVFEVFRNLARHGCYLRVGRSIEGPFTLQRAVELVQRRVRNSPRVRKKLRIRVGRESRWQNVDDFESWCLTHSANLKGAAGNRERAFGATEASAPVHVPVRRDGKGASDTSRSAISAGAVDGLFASRPEAWSDEKSVPHRPAPVEPVGQGGTVAPHDQEETLATEPARNAAEASGSESPGKNTCDDTNDSERVQSASASDRLDRNANPGHQDRPVHKRKGSNQRKGRRYRKNSSKRKISVNRLRSSSKFGCDGWDNPQARLATPSAPRQPLNDESESVVERASSLAHDGGAHDRLGQSLVETPIQPAVAQSDRTKHGDLTGPQGGRPLPPPVAYPRHRRRDGKVWVLAIAASLVGLACWFYPTDNGESDSGFMAASWRDDGSGELSHGRLVLTNAVAPTESRFVSESVPHGMLFTPSIDTPQGTARNFHCFAAYASKRNRPVLLSALSLLGPRGGLEEPISALDAFTSVRSVDLCDLQSGQVTRQVPGTTVIVPGADHWPAASLHGDVFAFRPREELHLRPLSLSDRPAKPGQDVWLLHRCRDNSTVTHGVIEGAEDSWGVFSIPVAQLGHVDAQQLAGAPILNSQDEVVGIVAWTEVVDGRLIGRMTPAHLFAEYL